MQKNLIQSHMKQHQCYICKRPASFYRFSKGKGNYLCDDKKCNKVSLINLGYISYIKLPQDKV